MCHLQFWQTDWGLLRATAVTRHGTGTTKQSALTVFSEEEHFPNAPTGIGARNLSITSLTLSRQAIPAQYTRKDYFSPHFIFLYIDMQLLQIDIVYVPYLLLTTRHATWRIGQQ